MKKLSFVLGLFFVVALSSCDKEKDCKCVTSGTGVELETITTIDDGECSDGNSTTTINGSTVTTTCTEQ